MFADAQKRGVTFKNTLTIGKLSLCVYPEEWEMLSQVYPQVIPLLSRYTFGDRDEAYLRTMFSIDSLATMDFSSYEGATLLHDLSTPVAKELHRAFDVVIEAGTIEHVFDIKTALANVMEMVSIGGTLFISTPANNFCGHGFYQLSPELLFRALSEEHGFSLKHVWLVEGKYPSFELSRAAAVYDVRDPVAVRRRIGVQSATPLMMLAEARRINDNTPFTRPVLQSDYVATWNGGGDVDRMSPLLKKLKSIFARLPQNIRHLIEGAALRRRYSLSNRNVYTPVDLKKRLRSL